MKTLLKIFAFTLMLLHLNGCSDYQDTFSLQKTVFIEDAENPGLPIYSEWGYNTFGAYIDRQVFACDNTNLPNKIIVNTDTLNMLFKGSMGGSPTSIRFSLKGYPISDYKNLKTLNDVTINLKSPNCVVTLTRGSKVEVLRIIEGSIHFKRIQDLYVDNTYTKAIVSGIFSFKTFFDTEPVAISNGRFDLGIGYENFYNF